MAHRSVRKCCSWVNFRRNIFNLPRHFDALQLIRWSCGWADCVLKECVLLGYDKWMFRGTTFSTPRILDSSSDRHPLHPAPALGWKIFISSVKGKILNLWQKSATVSRASFTILWIWNWRYRILLEYHCHGPRMYQQHSKTKSAIANDLPLSLFWVEERPVVALPGEKSAG